jgi:hypothetical protein
MSGTYSNPPCTHEGYKKNSITLAILVGFLVNSLFHETKIPTVDMKVQVNSKFRNYFFWKKVKSPLSMNFGRISTSKCRGQASKNGGAIHPFSQKPWPISQTSKNSFFKNK